MHVLFKILGLIVRAAGRHASLDLGEHGRQFGIDLPAVDFVIHMSRDLLRFQNAGVLHALQVPGDNRAVLGHGFRDGADVRTAVYD